MRLGVIHLPRYTNDGESLADLHGDLAHALLNAFGGCTSFKADGFWRDNGKDYVEDVQVYQVAADDTGVNNAKLSQIAIHYGVAADQIAVYTQDFSGEVRILPCDCRVPTEGIHP